MSDLRYYVYVPSPNKGLNMPASSDDLLPAGKVAQAVNCRLWPEKVRIDEYRPFSLEKDMDGAAVRVLATEAYRGLTNGLYVPLSLCWDDGEFTFTRPKELAEALGETLANYVRTPGAVDTENAPWQPTGRSWTLEKWLESGITVDRIREQNAGLLSRIEALEAEFRRLKEQLEENKRLRAQVDALEDMLDESESYDYSDLNLDTL